jgi:hypothetical protein
MIVHRVGDELWLFDQLNHSSICGDLAEAWGAAPFANVPPEVQRAAAVHDSGWPEWDRRPRLNPATGYPHPYSDMPGDDYRAIWERGLARAWAEGPLVGLLVSLHAMRFFGHKQRPKERALFERQQTLQRYHAAVGPLNIRCEPLVPRPASADGSPDSWERYRPSQPVRAFVRLQYYVDAALRGLRIYGDSASTPQRESGHTAAEAVGACPSRSAGPSPGRT